LLNTLKDDAQNKVDTPHKVFQDIKKSTGLDMRAVLNNIAKEKSLENKSLVNLKNIAEQKGVNIDAWDDSNIDKLYGQPKNMSLAIDRFSTMKKLAVKKSIGDDPKFLAALDKIRSKNEGSATKKLFEKYSALIANQRVDHWEVFPSSLNDVRKKFSDSILDDYPISPLPNKASAEKIKELQKYIDEVAED
jgi:hypothetical protein